MKSVIVNMADRMKDAEDLKLETLFASDPVPDNGFSVRVERRIRRQIWMRRLTLPVAVIVGGAISLKPLIGLLKALLGIFATLPANVSGSFAGISAIGLPPLSTIMLGGVAALALLMISRLLED